MVLNLDLTAYDAFKQTSENSPSLKHVAAIETNALILVPDVQPDR